MPFDRVFWLFDKGNLGKSGQRIFPRSCRQFDVAGRCLPDVETGFRHKESLVEFDRFVDVDFDSASLTQFIYVDSNASARRYGPLETSRKKISGWRARAYNTVFASSGVDA